LLSSPIGKNVSSASPTPRTRALTPLLLSLAPINGAKRR
jgi:hypothetical protein